MSSGDQTTNHRRKGHEPRLRTSYRSTMGRSTRCPKRRRPSLSGPSATGGLPQRSLREEARHGRRGSRAQRAEAPRGGREDGARRVRRDTCLHGIPAGTLAPDQDEQRNRAHQPRDQEESEGRRDLSGRQLTPQAGDGEAEVHSGARMGQEEVPGNVQAGKDGQAEGKGGGQEEKGTEDG